GQNRRGGTRESGEEQQQVVFQVVQRFGRDLQGPDIHAAVLVKIKRRDAAERSDVLVLFPDGFAQQVDLDMAGLFGQRLARDGLLIQRVQRAQQRDGETPR